jgi:hypothetical protein
MGGCTLRFTKNSPLGTALVDEATGHVKYMIETPMKIARAVTRIRRFGPHTQPPHNSDEYAGTDSDDDITLCGTIKGEHGSGEVKGDETDLEMPGASNEIARIDWKLFSPDKMVLQGREHIQSEFLPKRRKVEGSYTFVGPGGVQYRWVMDTIGFLFPKLVTADEKTVIAEFHCPNYLITDQKPRLEVRAEGMEMLDCIVLTFVYAENKRRQREGKNIGG